MKPQLSNPFAEEPLAEVVQLRDSVDQAPAEAAPAVQVEQSPSVLKQAASSWWVSATQTLDSAISGDSVLHDRLPSLAELWRELVDAKWAPADADALILFGRAYRLLIAIPLSAIAYPLLYLAHRPLRLFLALAVMAMATVCIFVFA